MAEYVPDRGDVVWLRFDARLGHEQSGRRPALVISPRAYNRRAGLALFCPITSRVKGYPFEVVFPKGAKVDGAVLCDQIKSLDWRVRKAKRLGPAPASVVRESTAKLLALVDPA
ncbi:MAG: endoribonuclease MazF [Actinomycetota bacterium]